MRRKRRTHFEVFVLAIRRVKSCEIAPRQGSASWEGSQAARLTLCLAVPDVQALDLLEQFADVRHRTDQVRDALGLEVLAEVAECLQAGRDALERLREETG